jgi:hypothetical protein
MDQRNRQHIHDRSDDAEAPLRAEAGTGRTGTAAGATSRAFVVELTSGVTDASSFSGRVQHLTTLDGGNFTSAESLVAIIRRVLERARRDDAQRNQFDK